MGISYLIFIPLVLAVIAVVIAVAMRKPRHTYRGESDARNFDSGGPTFYPGDAMESPSSTPPPRQFENDASSLEGDHSHHHHHHSSDAPGLADDSLPGAEAGSSAPPADSSSSYDSGSSAGDSGSSFDSGSSSSDGGGSSSDSGSSGGSSD